MIGNSLRARRKGRLQTVRARIAAAAGALALGAAALTLPAAPAQAAPTGFVTRCGIHFCLDGKTFYFAGANTYDVFTYGGSWGDTETTYMDKARIDAHFTQLAADKVTVLRLWMFDHEQWHGFEPSKGVYNDQQFALFDYVIDSAARHNVRLIPVFENYWEAYGGIDTRLSWEGLPTGQANRWRFFNKAACPGCFTQYKNYVNYALNRVNHYTGVAYKDDPTIMAWELMNEPRYEGQGTAESSNGTTLRAWVDEMGAYVKSIDGKHLLGTGMEGHQAKYGFGGDEGNPFVYIQQSPYIDFTSAHPYPDEGWAGLDITKTKALIRAWISDSHDVVGKPFFMGEWNVHQDWTTWWSQIYADFEAADGDGSAFWWYKDGTGSPAGFDTYKGSPQLSVFTAHSQRMAAKNGPVGTTTTTTRPTTTTSTTIRPTTTTTSALTTTTTTSALTTTTTTRPVTTTTTTTGAPTTTTTTRPVTTTTTTRPATTTTTTPTTTATTTSSGSKTCTATYAVVGSWPGGFQGDVRITAGGQAISGWTVTWTYPNGQVISQSWGAALSQTGASVIASNVAWNGALGAGASTSFGLIASWNGSNSVPAVSCTAV